MKTLLLPLLLLSISYSLVTAQKAKNIPIDLLKQTVHPTDSSAVAAYDFQKVEVSYDLQNRSGILLNMKYRFRLKVYAEGGEKYAEFQIPTYHSGGDKERVTKITGITANLNNGKPEVVKLNKDQIFKEETSDDYTTVKFAMPKVKPGSVIDVSYQIISPWIYTIPKWYFQHDIPTNQSVYEIDVPEYFSLTPVPSGAFPISKEEKDSKNFGFGLTTTTLTARDVPALEEDDYVLNDNDYRSGIKYELYSIHIPGQFSQDYSKDWNSIVKNLNEAEYFGKQLDKKHKELDQFVATLEGMSIDEKTAEVYNYVQTNFSWDENYGIGSYDGFKKVLQNRSGNIGDINLILIYMLRKAKVPVNPYVSKSRYSGLLNINFPSLSELNYTMAAIPQQDGEHLLLDASCKNNPIGQLPVRAINITGLVLQGERAIPYYSSNPNLFKIQTVSKYELDLENATISGNSTRKRSNYASYKYRMDMERSNNNEDEQSSGTKADNQESDIESFDIENTYSVTELHGLESINEPVKISFDEKLVTCMKKVGDTHFLDATLDFGIDRNPFEEDERQFPVFYNSRVDSKTIASFQLPEGYVIEEKPDDMNIALPNSMAKFSYEIKSQGSSVIIYYILKINEDIILPQDYPGLKKFYDMIYDLSKEKIVIAKA